MFRLLFLFIIGASVNANALGENCREGLQTCGTSSSGGGSAVVCRDASGKADSATLLDLYEGRYAYGLNVLNRPGSIEEQLDIIFQIKLSEINIFGLGDILVNVDRTRRIMRVLDNVVRPAPIDDIKPIIIPRECEIEQLAHYVDDDLLLVDKEIWSLLDNTNKTALIMHEALYRFERSSGAKDSRRSRKVVAHMFSDYEFKKLSKHDPVFGPWCEAIADEDRGTSNPGYIFTAKKIKHAGPHSDYDWWEYKLEFKTIAGKSVYSRVTGEIPLLGEFMRRDQQGEIGGGYYKSDLETFGKEFSIGYQKSGGSGLHGRFYFIKNNKRYFINNSCFDKAE